MLMRRLTPFPNGSDHALSSPFLVDLPRVAREGPEATPLTSPASKFRLPSGHQSDSELPQGLATLWVEKRPLVQQASLGLQSHGEP